MEKKSNIVKNIFVSEEEKTLDWPEVQKAFEKTLGTKIFSSWLKDISLVKEYNDYLILSVPTRFIRDWIVSRYLDKILEQIKTFKKSLNRVEFKISDESRVSNDNLKINSINPITEIKDSILNYNRLNPNLSFKNFIEGKSNEIALFFVKESLRTNF